MKLAAAAAILALGASSASAQGVDEVIAASVAKSKNAPGCAIGVAEAGKPPTFRAWGLADLEHGVPITPDTIFEAGSVAKQFTAAAVLTLVQDGKLKLTDDIRKHLPEMPAYGAPITVDHLLSHTSGLRDWGEVAAAGGWPRGSRAYTNLEALEIASRQKALNYPTGSAYSYTNTGYNLAAVIVSRVSGQSFADFSRERLFKPLGLTKTQWRDDFRRVVPGRAQAYALTPRGFHLSMPFEDVHGNGGLLTTVANLLAWNEALASGKLGPAVTAQLHERATLTSGRRIEYARGVAVGTFRGVAEVSHSGSTGGYRAWLARYPDNGLSVAVLCNGSNADGELGGKLAAAHLPKARDAAPAPAAPAAFTPEQIASLPGIYVSGGALNIARVVAEGGGLRIQGGPAFTVLGPAAYKAGDREVRFGPGGTMERRSEDGEVTTFRRHAPGWTPSAAELAEVTGVYASNEAGARVIVTAKDGALVVAHSDRPGAPARLSPLFKDAFAQPGSLLHVVRDRRGKVSGLRYQGGRVYDLRFRKVG